MKRYGYILIAVCLVATNAFGADWPQWRADAKRSATSAKSLPDKLHLQWTKRYPTLRPAFWQIRQGRLQFDAGYEPVVAGKTLFVGSSHNDSVTALDTDTGRQRWKFYADGPVRLAPVAADGKVFFGSDDGRVYCLSASSGKLLWSRRGAPSGRQVLGNGRLISVWPVRGGPVLVNGRVYFAAGVWPFEGIFVCALDAATGRRIWVNDKCGSMYIKHPHGAMAFGGLAPQGYLAVHKDELIVPCSRAFPAYFDLATGKLNSFAFGHGGHGSLPGGWFFATGRRGEMLIDSDVNTGVHDAGQQIVGQSGSSRKPNEKLKNRVQVGGRSYAIQRGAQREIRVGAKTYRFDDGFAAVKGAVHTMLAADDKLFVVTRRGDIHCFGAQRVEPKIHANRPELIERRADEWGAQADKILKLSGASEGYALVAGPGDSRLVDALAVRSKLQIVVVDPDARKIATLRRRLDAAGLYGRRVTARVGEPSEANLPPYFANLIVASSPQDAGKLFRSLRPYGGTMCLQTPENKHDIIVKQCPKAKTKRVGGMSVIVRAGKLDGTAGYTGKPNYDELVKAPLRVLWFGDTFHHHKLFDRAVPKGPRGLPANIRVAGGVMRYAVRNSPVGPRGKRKYEDFIRTVVAPHMYKEGYIDVYTGRDFTQRQPDQTPEKNRHAKTSATRKNPLTGAVEKRAYLKTYGCDETAGDYGHILTMRSGTAAYYDKRVESGTVSISGLRSGCRNTIIAADGVLSLPSWTGNCTCNYPVFTSLALVHAGEDYEQWSAWGDVGADGAVRRVGINFGAPGDRATPEGTLWLDHPSVGGPSPNLPVSVLPQTAKSYYKHALWARGGQGRPWVIASGVMGVRQVRIVPVVRRFSKPKDGKPRKIKPIKPCPSYTVRLYFASPDTTKRVFSVSLQGHQVLKNLDVATEAGGPMHGLVKEFKNIGVQRDLIISLTPSKGEPILSGVELIAD
ncbi:MAG: PQQ-binding-like beta-propeller repeat protein [Phycisphaerales bacterium]|nr:PQQ-binding-like beta-propeller repeat protein [Phycisphaerales bacterium]